MNALRRQNIRPQQTFERWTPRTQESPHELARQSEAKRKQAPQSEANVCRRRKCNLKKTSLINCTGHPIMHITPNTNRACILVPRTQKAFQYKVLNSILFTNKKLCKIGYIQDDKCSLCKTDLGFFRMKTHQAVLEGISILLLHIDKRIHLSDLT